MDHIPRLLTLTQAGAQQPVIELNHHRRIANSDKVRG